MSASKRSRAKTTPEYVAQLRENWRAAPYNTKQRNHLKRVYLRALRRLEEAQVEGR